MEIAGLTTGVLALAGLCSTCLEAFNLIGVAKDFSVDYEILSIKLDIEKTRLLQWAEGVGLLSEDRGDQNGFILSGDIQPLLERILGAVKLLLTKSDDLCTKYGLSPDRTVSAGVTNEPIFAVSNARTQRFQLAFGRAQVRNSRQLQDTALGNKTKWVIKDRGKFEDLLRHLHQLISSLNELAPLPKSFRRLLVKEDIDDMADDLSGLRLLQVASKGQDQEWEDFASLRVEASQKITQDFRSLEEWLEDVESQDQELPDLIEYRSEDTEGERAKQNGGVEAVGEESGEEESEFPPFFLLKSTQRLTCSFPPAIESRVARIKARVAELTGGTYKAQHDKRPPVDYKVNPEDLSLD